MSSSTRSEKKSNPGSQKKERNPGGAGPKCRKIGARDKRVKGAQSVANSPAGDNSQPVIAVVEDSLDTLIAQIKAALHEGDGIRLRMRRVGIEAIHWAHRVGGMLVEAKDRPGRGGGWETWLDETFKLSEKLANNYMRVAREWDIVEPMLDANPNSDSEITLTAVLKALEKPRKKAAKVADGTDSGAGPNHGEEHHGPGAPGEPEAASEPASDHEPPDAPAADRAVNGADPDPIDACDSTDDGPSEGQEDEPRGADAAGELVDAQEPPSARMLTPAVKTPATTLAWPGVTNPADMVVLSHARELIVEAVQTLYQHFNGMGEDEEDMWRGADFWKAVYQYLFGENFGALLGSISPSDWRGCGDCGGRGEFQGDPCYTCGTLGMTVRKALNLEVEAAAD